MMISSHYCVKCLLFPQLALHQHVSDETFLFKHTLLSYTAVIVYNVGNLIILSPFSPPDVLNQIVFKLQLLLQILSSSDHVI